MPREGGAYTLPCHPDVLTVLYFPADVLVAYSVQEPPGLVVKQHARTVTVQPRRGVQHATVAIATEAFRVGLLFELVERPEDAVIQVDFQPLALEQEVERRADEKAEARWLDAQAALDRERAAIEQARAALAAREARLQALIREAALQQVADGLRTHHRAFPAAGAARQHHIALRLRRVIWLGADAYVVFTVENRRRAHALLDTVELGVGGLGQPTVVSFPAPEATDEASDERGILGVVPPRSVQRGVAVLRDAGTWVGETATLRVWARPAEAPGEAPPLTISFPLTD